MLKKVILFLFLFTYPSSFAATRSASLDTLKAAFIRSDDLWIKVGNREQKITHNEYIRYPKWSPDGNWIAYLKVTKKGKPPLNDGELWLFNYKTNNHFKIRANVNNNFQWAPLDNKISFLVIKHLYTLNLDPAIPFLTNKMGENIENFSWLPDGSGFLTSSKESKQLHSDILLSKITLGSYKPAIRPFFKIPVSDNEFFISTSQFKWSHDQKWISFLLVPTASLSADANTLCLLSQDGQFFKKEAEMLYEEEWFKWAPSETLLGYVKGIGREANLNKQVDIIHAPPLSKKSLTPKGYVDRDISWKNSSAIFVARAKEEPQADMNKRPMPRIYEINLALGQPKQITLPAEKEADFAPRFVNDRLLWIRTNTNTASVFVSRAEAEDKWINHITMPSTYYDRWNWDEVFSLYKGQ
ncbi:hypothetical protein V7266_12535 [Neobacillus drentensis]|uniref:TolB family protein n=1 Tax=Neobacillus drentensis TaxID=220684 RepID=UPI002FFE40D5